MEEKNNRSTTSARRGPGRHGNRGSGSAKRSSKIRILDYLPQGKNMAAARPGASAALLQGIDEDTLSLLEIYPREGVIPAVGVTAGPDDIGRVKGRIAYDELSRTAQLELPVALDEILRRREETFIRFFNEPKPMGLRLNSLNFLPGIGEKQDRKSVV